jgi:hypothetical protein
MDAKRLKELRTLCENATPGPWVVEADSRVRRGTRNNPLVSHSVLGVVAIDKPDATFIAEARTALPEALEEITIQVEVIRQLKMFHEILAKTIDQQTARITELEAQVAALEAKRLELEGQNK